MFNVGDYVKKTRGKTAGATGWVVSIFTTRAGDTRYVLEFEAIPGLLHIQGESDLELVEPEATQEVEDEMAATPDDLARDLHAEYEWADSLLFSPYPSSNTAKLHRLAMSVIRRCLAAESKLEPKKNEGMAVGEICRAKCGAPAPYVGEGLCVYVSAMGNDLSHDEAKPPEGNEVCAVLPSNLGLLKYVTKNLPHLVSEFFPCTPNR